MEALCKTIFDGDKILPLDSLIEYCETHTAEAMQFKPLLYGLHLMKWEDQLSHIDDIDAIGCNSMYTFYCIMILTIPRQVAHNPYLSDFPLIRIHEKWTFNMYDGPVCNMTQEMITNTLMGLEWHMMNDLYFEHRTEDWLQQCKQLFQIIKERISFLCTSSHTTDILDMADYREEDVKTSDDESVVIVNYDSDEEVYREQLAQMNSAIDYSIYETKLVQVNQAYVYLCDTYITSMDLGLYRHYMADKFQPDMEIKVGTFRTWLYEKMRDMNESHVGNFQTKWYESLVVSDTYIRIHKYKFGIYDLCNTRHILLMYNEDLIMPPITTFREITTRPGINATKRIQLTSDGVFVCYTMSFGAIIKVLLWEKLSIPEGIYIYRDKIRNMWVYQVNSSERWIVSSFMEAFIGLRIVMRTRNMNSYCRDVNIDIYDHVIFN